MTMDHVVKIGKVIVPIVKTLQDATLLVDVAGWRARYVPSAKCIIGTDCRTGRIVSVKI